MFPIAGVVIWLLLGGVIGVLTSKITGSDDPNGLMANVGVGWVAAAVAGSLVAFFCNGDRSDSAFWASIAIAAGAAVVSTGLFRLFFPRHAPTLR